MERHDAMMTRAVDIAEYKKHGYGTRKRMMLPQGEGQKATAGVSYEPDLEKPSSSSTSCNKQRANSGVRVMPLRSTAKARNELVVDTTGASASPQQNDINVKRERQAIELAQGATIKLYYETPEELESRQALDVKYSETIQTMSLLNAKRRKANALARRESLTKKEERVKKSWKAKEWTLYRKTYLQKMRSVEAMKHSHQRIRDMYSKATFRPPGHTEHHDHEQSNINASARKGRANLHVAHRQTQLEQQQAGGGTVPNSFVPTLPCRAQHIVPNPWSSSGMHFKGNRVKDLTEKKSPRQQRIKKFQKAMYVDEEAREIDLSTPPRTERSIATTSTLIVDPGQVLRDAKQHCHRPTANVGQLIPKFPKNSGPTRPVSSRHKRATYFVHHLRARTAGLGGAVRSRQESEGAKLVPDIIQRSIELNVKKLYATPIGQNFLRMNDRAKSNTQKVSNRMQPSSRRDKTTTRGVGFPKFNFLRVSHGNDKAKLGRSHLQNEGFIRVPQIHLSPFRAEQRKHALAKGERSRIEISGKGEDMNAKVTLKSPPPAFDPSDLSGWD